MSFHQKQIDALRAYDAFVEAHPAMTAQAGILKTHYMDGGLEKAAPVLLQASLYLLTHDNFSAAAGAMSRKMQIHVMNTEKHIIDAINQGPEALKADEDFLHGKGVMRGASRYFLGYKGIEPGGIYDRAWQEMNPAYRPIMAEALEAAMKRRKTISIPVMKYVAVSLMPEGDRKLFQLNKLSVDYNGKHRDHMQAAADFVRHTAKHLDIVLPEAMMGGALVHKSQRLPPLPPSITHAPAPKVEKASERAATVLPRIPRPAVAPVVVREKFRDETTPKTKQDLSPEERELQTLKQNLRRLIKREKISERAANMYYRLQSDPEFGVEDAAEKIGKSANVVRILMVDVKTKLRALEIANQPGVSDGNLHKAGAVRP